MTRYLITGGAGFIGSHLCEMLLRAGDEVYCIDDLSTGAIGNIAHLKHWDRFHYTIDNVMNRQVTAELVDTVDRVFHLAAAVGVRLIVENPVRTIETNVAATELLLSLCAKKGKPILLASTSEVYGRSTELPFRESGALVLGAPTNSRWGYACSKALDEFMGMAYHRERGLPVVIARLFNTVGPRQTGRYGMVLPTFVRQALAGGPITVHGDGSQTRCFCDVRDVVRALAALLDTSESYGRIYNVGSSDEISIYELARLVRDQVGKPNAEIRLVAYTQAFESGLGFEDMARRKPCLEKIRVAIGWAPEIRLPQTVADVAAHQSR